MCNINKLAALVLFYLIIQTTLARRTRKSKPKDDDETTPQPNVVTYSTFGFNDVGQTYDGFVPSSPDYASFLSGYGSAPESSTRLYAPAFPTAIDSPYNSFGQQQQEPQGFPGGDNSEPSSMMHYQQSFNFGHPFDARNADSFQSGGNDNSDDFNSPVYGAKIGSKGKGRPFGPFNASNIYGGETFNIQDQTFTVQDPQPSQESKPNGESSNNFMNMYNYAQTFPAINVEDTSAKTTTQQPVAHSSMRFQKVVDFTKFKPNYPSEVDSKYLAGSMKSVNAFNSMSNSENYPSNFNKENENPSPDSQDDSDRYAQQPIGTNIMDYSINHITDNSNTKNNFKNSKLYAEYKDQFKSKTPYNYSSDYSPHWKSSFKTPNYNKSTSFSYSYSGSKRPHKTSPEDSQVPSSSNIHASSYRFPDSESYYKNKQQALENYPSTYHQYKFQEEAMNDELYGHMKNPHTTTPPSTSSHWGSYFKNNNDYTSSSQKNRHKRPHYSDDNGDEIVHIPKRHKYHISKQKHSKNKPWHKESTRFKSEEDLLGLRNHDTSHPSYIPDFKLNSDNDDDFQKYASENSYKNLMDKWRQAYLKSKHTKEYKDSTIYKDHDGYFKDQYESYASESRPALSPVPKPYPIEVPHPVIVPVPQPYPVRVPVPKPVAVPVIKELTVPIEKPVPYPVIKKVPYPIEKLVPVPVEKEVQVPVVKPYPVPVPHVRPVFHHSRHHSHEEMDESDSEEEPYYPHEERLESRPGKKIVRYSKRIRSSRPRSRRPTISFYDRTRRRWPSRRSPSTLRREVVLSRARRIKPIASSLHIEHSPGFKEYDDDDDY